MKSLTLGVMGWEGKRRKAAGAAKHHGERDACVQPCVGRLAPQGTGEQRGDKCWVGRPPAASPWMLCSADSRWGWDLGSLSRSLERGLTGAVGLHGLVSWLMQGTESWGGGQGRQERPR